MTSFPASEPITAVVDVFAGSLHVVASDRDDAVVTVLPADPGRSADGRAAEETLVELTAGTLTVTTPRSWRQYLPLSPGTVTVTVELPAGSSLTGKLSAGSLYAEGRLGAVDVRTAAGDLRVDEAGRLDLRTSAGSVVVGRATGATSVRSSAGSVRIAELAGDGTVRSGAGDTTVGSVTGSLQVSATHGDIIVGRLRGTLTAKASSGAIRVGRVESGTATLSTSYGSIELGVPEGTAAWLDITSQHGTVHNELRPADGPVDDETTAEVHASTGYGDIIVRRP
ncbi:MAG: DUF4097 family beta strand repeat-containing protein [Cellulomonas sp.]